MEFPACDLDVMEIVSGGNNWRDRDYYLENMPCVPKRGVILRDVSRVEIGGKMVGRPLLMHLLECPYLEEGRGEGLAGGLSEHDGAADG